METLIQVFQSWDWTGVKARLIKDQSYKLDWTQQGGKMSSLVNPVKGRRCVHWSSSYHSVLLLHMWVTLRRVQLQCEKFYVYGFTYEFRDKSTKKTNTTNPDNSPHRLLHIVIHQLYKRYIRTTTMHTLFPHVNWEDMCGENVRTSHRHSFLKIAAGDMTRWMWNIRRVSCVIIVLLFLQSTQHAVKCQSEVHL